MDERAGVKRTRRLLFVVKTLAFRGGGAERVLTTLTGALAKAGHEVAIATFDAAGAEPFFALDPAVELLPLDVGNVGSVSTWREVLRRSRALRRLARNRRPDAVIGFLNSAYVPLALGLVKTGIPAIASEHTVYGHYRGRHLEKLLLEIAYPLLSRTSAVTEAMRQTFPVRMRNKMVVLPNPVTAPGRFADTDGAVTKTVLTVGSLEALKDQATLVAAFARIAKQFPDWRLKIVGEGSLRQSLQAQVDAAGLTDRIHLPGALKQIGDEYASAQLFVLPSRYEGFGLVTAEAMAHGLPVIGFADCPGTNELIESGVNGVLVSGPRRIDGLAKAMAQLMASPEDRRRLGNAGRTAKTADLGSVVAAWEAMLSSACSARTDFQD